MVISIMFSCLFQVGTKYFGVFALINTKGYFNSE